MKQALGHVKGVLGAREITPHLTHYLVQDGRLWASDGRCVASTPVALEGRFLVPGDELGALLGRMPDDYTVALDGGFLKIRAGRRHGRIAVLREEVAYPTPDEGAWRGYPAGLTRALKRIRPFISDNAIHPWMTCAGVVGQEIFATSNVSLARTTCAALPDEGAGLLPAWVLDFLFGAEEAPVSWYMTDNHVAFLWADGTWFRSQLPAGEFSGRAADLIRGVEAPEWCIPGEWREAYDYVAGVSQKGLVVETNRVRGGRGFADVEHETPDTPVPDTGQSSWDLKFLAPVIEAATHWAPDMWPKPSPWAGDQIQGLVMGRPV